MFRRNVITNGNKINNKLITSVAVAPDAPTRTDKYFNGNTSSQIKQNITATNQSLSSEGSSYSKSPATSQSFSNSNQTTPIKSNWWRSNAI